jgi:hypothetical protein
MNRAAVITADLLAIFVLCFALYLPRHHRRDMLPAYLGLNVGVMTVAVALTSNQSIGTGFGLGLFGTLSIIRLRSSELGQQEVAYYFAALALGMIGGIEVDPAWASFALTAAIVAVMFVADHPVFARRHRQQIITLDRAIPNETDLRIELERLLAGEVLWLETRKLDLVNDSTVVDVRFRVAKAGTDS